MTDIHNFDAENGTYLGTTKARLDPLEGKPMVPANATLVAPPKSGAQKVAVWGGDGWSLKPDHRGTEYWLADGSRHFITEIGDELPEGALDASPSKSREDQRRDALARVDEEHADYLVRMTGGATVAERDTWKMKEEAARAFEAGTATAGQSAMLSAEALGAGETEAERAATIVSKADAFLVIVGTAGGIRARARAAIMTATHSSVPIDEVEGRIATEITRLSEEVQSAIAQVSTES